jgi:hypothetical protein
MTRLERAYSPPFRLSPVCVRPEFPRHFGAATGDRKAKYADDV